MEERRDKVNSLCPLICSHAIKTKHKKNLTRIKFSIFTFNSQNFPSGTTPIFMIIDNRPFDDYTISYCELTIMPLRFSTLSLAFPVAKSTRKNLQKSHTILFIYSEVPAFIDCPVFMLSSGKHMCADRRNFVLALKCAY